MKEKIKKLLEEFRNNKTIIKELQNNYDLLDILDVSFEEKMYDVILDLFNPIEIDNELRFFFDFFTYISENGGINVFLDRFELSNEEKRKIEESVYNIDLEKIKTMKVKNTLPRQISGWANPVKTKKDIIYYSEPAVLESMLYLYDNNIRTISNDTACVYNTNKDLEIETEKTNEKSNIIIAYDSLSNENKEYANLLIEKNIAELKEKNEEDDFIELIIYVDTNENDTIGDISNRFNNIIKGFKKQKDNHNRISKETFFKYIKNNIINRCQTILINKTYEDYLIEVISNGLVPEDKNGNITLSDGRCFSLDTAIEVLINNEEFIDEYSQACGYYYDENEKILWKSRESYEKYIKEKMLENTEDQKEIIDNINHK